MTSISSSLLQGFGARWMLCFLKFQTRSISDGVWLDNLHSLSDYLLCNSPRVKCTELIAWQTVHCMQSNNESERHIGRHYVAGARGESCIYMQGTGNSLQEDPNAKNGWSKHPHRYVHIMLLFQFSLSFSHITQLWAEGEEAIKATLYYLKWFSILPVLYSCNL